MELKRSTRCSACKLPNATLEELHRDRFDRLETLETLARRYGTDEHPLSEPGLRRHLGNHVIGVGGSENGESACCKDVPNGTTVFENLLARPLNEGAILDAAIRVLLWHLHKLDRRSESASVTAERSLPLFLNATGALQRMLARRAELRLPTDDLRELGAKLFPTLTKFAYAVFPDALTGFEGELIATQGEVEKPSVSEVERRARYEKIRAKWAFELRNKFISAFVGVLQSPDLKMLLRE